jgi:hypothetical protein
MGLVKVRRLLSNHCARSSVGLVGLYFAFAGVRSSHGVRAQFGDDWASLSVGGAIFVGITVWSELEDGRMFCHECMKGMSAWFTKVKSMTPLHCFWSFGRRVSEPGVLRRRKCLSEALRK